MANESKFLKGIGFLQRFCYLKCIEVQPLRVSFYAIAIAKHYFF